MRHLINIILLSTALQTTGSCDRQVATLEKPDIAEDLMDTKPDSALMALEGIPASNINGKKVVAGCAPLKSMVLNKNSIDTTTFNVLQPAIDYYIKNGTPNE